MRSVVGVPSKAQLVALIKDIKAKPDGIDLRRQCAATAVTDAGQTDREADDGFR